MWTSRCEAKRVNVVVRVLSCFSLSLAVSKNRKSYRSGKVDNNRAAERNSLGDPNQVCELVTWVSNDPTDPGDADGR